MDRLKALATALQHSATAGYIAAVCLHGGTMEARAVHPRGTVVLLRLPLLPEQPDRRPEEGQ